MVSRFEMLEPRVLLDGDVTVTLTNGVLRITGDVESNGVTTAMAAGAMTVTGDVVDAATTLNGVAAPIAFTAEEVATITKIIVSLKGGDNELAFDANGIANVRSAKFQAGNDANELMVFDLEATGNVSLIVGKGGNTIFTGGVNPDGNLIVKSGNGDNTIQVVASTVGKNLQVKGGKAVDNVDVVDATVTGKFSLNSGKTGADVVTLDTVTAASSKVNGSADGTYTVIGAAPEGMVVTGLTINHAPTDETVIDLLDLVVGPDWVAPAPVIDANSDPAVVIGDDADDDVLVYSITFGNDAGIFAIDAATGAITIADETDLGDAGTSYDLTVSITDGIVTTEVGVTITVEL